MAASLIMDQSHHPSMEEIASYITGKDGSLWQDMVNFLETNFKVKREIAYSSCSGKPGWNVKYKKGGKALCTLYPEREAFTALVVLGQHERAVFDGTREEYSSMITDAYDECSLFNGTKWLMLPVQNEKNLAGVKKLITLKAQGKKKK